MLFHIGILINLDKKPKRQINEIMVPFPTNKSFKGKMKNFERSSTQIREMALEF